jgi:CMP-N-acetylneuraminic acid synthetase
VEPNPDLPPFVRPCLPAMVEGTRRQERPVVYALNGAVYVMQRSVLAKIENQFRFQRLAIYEMPRGRSIDIDDEEDLNLAELLLANSRSRPSTDV